MADVTIKNLEAVGNDAEAVGLLQACVARMAQYNRLENATLYVNERNKEGWLEYFMVMQYDDGGKLTVGALQRNTGMQFEFHS